MIGAITRPLSPPFPPHALTLPQTMPASILHTARLLRVNAPTAEAKLVHYIVGPMNYVLVLL